jgi:hypothetical protein
VEGQVHAARRAAEVIAAVPLARWPEHLTHLVARTGIAPDIALSEVFDAAGARAEDAQMRSRAVVSDRLSEGATDAAMETSTSQVPGGKPAAETLANSVQAAQRAASGGRTFRLPNPPRTRQRL